MPARPFVSRRRVAAVGVVAVVLVGASLLALRASRSAVDVDEAPAAAETAAPAGGTASETSAPAAQPVTGSVRTPDPCDLIPPALARRHAPHAARVPDLRPPEDPKAARRCTWKGLEVPDDGGTWRARELRLTVQAYDDADRADVKLGTVVFDMTDPEELEPTQRLLEDRALPDIGEGAHLQTIEDQDSMLPATRTSVVARHHNVVVLVEYFGSKVTFDAVGVQQTRSMEREETERVAEDVAAVVVTRLPERGQVAASAPPEPSDDGPVYRDPPKPCANLSPRLRDRTVPGAEELDYDDPELAEHLTPMEGTKERVCKWTNWGTPGDDQPAPDELRELTVRFTVFSGEGQRAVMEAVEGYGGWDITGPFGGGTINRFQRLPGLGDEAFVIAGHITPTLDSTDAYAGARSGNLIVSVHYSGSDPDGVPAEDFEAATVEILTDVVRRAVR